MADVTINSLPDLAPATNTYAPISNGSSTGKAPYYTSVQQGGGAGQLTNKLYMGWNGSRLLLQIDATNFSSTWPINADVNSAGRQYFGAGQGSGGIANAAGSLGGLECIGAGGTNAAFLCFHKPGAFAAYLGIDSDNQFKVGGWSMGANAYTLLHTGNAFGYAQTWQDVTASRAARTNYYNTTGRPIVVSVQCPSGGFQNYLYINDLIVDGVNFAGLANGQGWSVGIVPPAGKYYVDAQRAAPRWNELR
jgi:hypothetical protein